VPRPESKARFVNVRAGGVYQGLNDLAVQNVDNGVHLTPLTRHP